MRRWVLPSLLLLLSAVVTALLLVWAFRNRPPQIEAVTPGDGNFLPDRSVAFRVAATDPNGDPLTLFWDFGDGTRTRTTELAATHRYERGGRYTVTVRVEDGRGGVAQAQVTIDVNRAPLARFRMDPSQGAAPLTVAFDASASEDPDSPEGDATELSFYWDFGDGTQGQGVKVTHSYAQPGKYVVRLRVRDEYGAEGEAQEFIEVTPPGNRPPTARFEASSYRAFVGDPIEFDASASEDPDGTVVSWLWDFDGDDRPDARGATVRHAFESPGEYTVTLRVVDDQSASSTLSKVILVEVPRPPIARFTFSPPSPMEGDPVVLDATSSTGQDSEIVAYRWDLDGDGSVDREGERIQHTFPQPGRYTVTLIVVDRRGNQDRFTLAIEVAERPAPPPPPPEPTPPPPSNEPPVPRVRVPETLVAGEPIRLDASDSYDPDGRIAQYSWDLDGDGLPERITTDPVLVYTFPEPGRYTVSLLVQDDRGSTATLTLLLEVGSPGLPTPPPTSPGPGPEPEPAEPEGEGPSPLPTPPRSGLSHLAAEAAFLEDATLYKGFLGFTQSGSLYEIGFGYGEARIFKDGYPVSLRIYAVDFNRLIAVYEAVHLGIGIGVLALEGEYQIARPTLGPKAFLVYVPVVNLKIGWKLSFLMLSIGVSYPIELQELR